MNSSRILMPEHMQITDALQKLQKLHMKFFAHHFIDGVTCFHCEVLWPCPTMEILEELEITE